MAACRKRTCATTSSSPSRADRTSRARRSRAVSGRGRRNRDQFARVREGTVTWLQVFEEFARWISPIGMSPRRIAKAATVNGVDFAAGRPRVPDVRLGQPRRGSFRGSRQVRSRARYRQEHRVRRGAAFLRRCGRLARHDRRLALPSVFARLKGLALDEREPVRIGGWAFRGLFNLPVVWDMLFVCPDGAKRNRDRVPASAARAA